MDLLINIKKGIAGIRTIYNKTFSKMLSDFKFYCELEILRTVFKMPSEC
jgi:hypothetical protein